MRQEWRLMLTPSSPVELDADLCITQQSFSDVLHLPQVLQDVERTRDVAVHVNARLEAFP
jgi:hypothetical protein